MTDTTVKRVKSASAPVGSEGQVYLVSGKRMAMRMWRNEEPTTAKAPSRHDYEVLGFVLSGRAELSLEGQTVELEAGDSWLVPAHTEHSYRILETFTAVETTAPHYEVHHRES